MCESHLHRNDVFRRALRHVAWLTLQSPIVRIVAEIINGIAFSEQSAYEE
uniref:Transposase n=1 Tax=Ascaris lumbricoides TaxID=6252 RepID=A0A0M3IAC0_ASCLU